MIEVEHVYKAFNGQRVLEDISTTFSPGMTNLIIGRSGSGKTVMMKCMVGLLEADKGRILYDGRDFSAMDFHQRKEIRKEIGMLFQGTALFDSLTVEENVKFPLDMFTKKTKKEKQMRVDECLQQVNLVGANKKYPAEISGGMMKRVGIARAIVLQPKYLFCDEPNSGLDPKTSIIIDELIREITLSLNVTTIVNTHDMNSVLGIGDKIVFLHEGKKHWEGSRADVLKTDNEELNNFIFASKLLKELKKG